jgi:glucosamine--fructose-6-phosphate aminotransferase (isomerizing)
MNSDIGTTGIWHDITGLPNALKSALSKRAGWDELVLRLRQPDVERIIVTGNGASHYAGLAMWLASLRRHVTTDLACVSSGLLAEGAFDWVAGDVLLVVSTSGEFRDLIEVVKEVGARVPFYLVTAHRDSSLGQRAAAIASFDLPLNRAVTHTQDFCCATLTLLALWAQFTQDDTLIAAIEAVPQQCEASVRAAEAWADKAFQELKLPTAAIVFGHGSAWAAAMEAALLVKEVAQIPCEGLETREGATSAMTALGPEVLVLSLPTPGDPFIEEAEALCRSTGAPVLRAEVETGADGRLSPITCFPAAAALAIELALRKGCNPDKPNWVDNYYLTARVS